MNSDRLRCRACSPCLSTHDISPDAAQSVCSTSHPLAAKGSEEVDNETAAMVARSLHLVQGPQGPPTTAAQCRFLTAELLTGICLVSSPVPVAITAS